MFVKKIKRKIKAIPNFWYKGTKKNVFNSDYSSKALLSYITLPFVKQSYNHTNYFEAISLARVLNDLGYVVDVIEYTKIGFKNLDNYDVIIGFGEVFQHYFENHNKPIKTIYYGTGMHVCHQNTATLNRLKDVYLKKGVWLTESARYVEKTWSYQTTLVDGIVALGNESCASTYRKHYKGKIFSIPAPCYVTQNAMEILKKRAVTANKSFLWFGSVGLVHKGLDLLLEYFSKNNELQLHICGNLDSEKKFVAAYKEELYKNKNIHIHGFIDIDSAKFKKILESCSFIIFPSCSEGGCPSVITTIMNGALIPIVSKETSISTGNEIVIESLDIIGITEVVNKVMAFTPQEIISLQLKNYYYVLKNNNKENYYHELKTSIEQILHDE